MENRLHTRTARHTDVRTCVIALTTQLPDNLHGLLQLIYALAPYGLVCDRYFRSSTTLRPFLPCELDVESFTWELLGDVDRYSLGDAALQRWAVDEMLPLRLRDVLRPHLV